MSLEGIIIEEKWMIGPCISVSGLTKIYLAAAVEEWQENSNYPYVIKMEPFGYGNIITEIYFYFTTNALLKKNFRDIGIPLFIDAGSYLHDTPAMRSIAAPCNALANHLACRQQRSCVNAACTPCCTAVQAQHCGDGKLYSFIIIERFGKNLKEIFLENKKLSEGIVYKIFIKIIDTIEYIHSLSYSYGDIKGEHILLQYIDRNTLPKIFLVDFGTIKNYAKKTKIDKNKYINANILFLSRDLYRGVPSMKSDFEMMLYNMIMFLGGSLPWADVQNCEQSFEKITLINTEKEQAFQDPEKFLTTCFAPLQIPQSILKFMLLVESINCYETPNYDKFREILQY